MSRDESHWPGRFFPGRPSGCVIIARARARDFCAGTSWNRTIVNADNTLPFASERAVTYELRNVFVQAAPDRSRHPIWNSAMVMWSAKVSWTMLTGSPRIFVCSRPSLPLDYVIPRSSPFANRARAVHLRTADRSFAGEMMRNESQIRDHHAPCGNSVDSHTYSRVLR